MTSWPDTAGGFKSMQESDRRLSLSTESWAVNRMPVTRWSEFDAASRSCRLLEFWKIIASPQDAAGIPLIGNAR